MSVARLLAPAKINLGLEILGKRADGYHEIRTVMQALALSDVVIAGPAPRNSLITNVDDLAGSDNLAMRAAELWSKSLDPQLRGLMLSLEKRIPAAAGLGGASSDAAAVLRLANAVYGSAVSNDTLANAAAQLGSDVPFFLGAATAVASGRGEILEPIPSARVTYFVVATANVDIPRKTATMYGLLAPGDFSDGSRIASFAQRLRAGEPIQPEDLENAFVRSLLKLAPQLEEIRENMRSLGAMRIGLSGAGPSWYAVLDSLDEATGLAESLRKQLPAVRIEATQALLSPPAISWVETRNGAGVSGV